MLCILTKICTFDTYDYYKTILLLYVLTTLVQDSLKVAIAPKHAAANYKGRSEINASYFIMLAHKVRGGC